MHTAKRLTKALKLTSIAVFAAMLPLNANAIIIGPIIDPLNIAENLAKQMADLESRLADEIERTAKRTLKTELKKAIGIEKASRAATEQQAEQKMETSLRNHEVAQENMPVSGLCDNTYIVNDSGVLLETNRTKSSILTFSMSSDYLRNAACERLFDKQEEERGDTLPGFEEIDLAQKAQKQNEKVEKVVEQFEDNKMSVNEILPHTMIGLTQEEYENALFKAKIMFPPIENTDVSTFDDKKQYLLDTSKSMRAFLPYQTQQQQIEEKLRPTDNMRSERESQVDFASDFLDPENLESYAFNNMILPSQVKREKAIMTAFLVHMAIQHYKSSLDKELLLSVRLLENTPN